MEYLVFANTGNPTDFNGVAASSVRNCIGVCIGLCNIVCHGRCNNIIRGSLDLGIFGETTVRQSNRRAENAPTCPTLGTEIVCC